MKSDKDCSFVSANLYGVLRHYFSINIHLEKLATKKFSKKDNSLKSLLLTGLYQIHFMKVPLYATVSENVEAVRLMKKPWATKLVNAILRNSIRKSKNSNHLSKSSNLEHFLWYTRKCQADWPENWYKILRANNEHPPLTLRVNPKRFAREEYSRLLSSRGFLNTKTKFAEHGIRLAEPVDPTMLPFFEQGACSVQDEAAQLPVQFLQLESARNILDLCAAPGGKTNQILENSKPGTKVLAVDRHLDRVRRLRENLSRLKQSCEIKVADALETHSWWNGEKFDRILIDAPCSSSGVIRRHPDIKIRRKKEEITKLSQLQLQILKNIWPLLKSEGILIYVTCSVFRDENDNLIKKFVADTEGAFIDPIEGNWGHLLHYGNQIFPGESDMDGFYFCRMVKR